MSDSVSSLPTRVTVKEILASRYDSRGHERPADWGERVAGADSVRTSDGQVVRLASDGQQSPPQPGWVIMLTDGNAADGYAWTLYGMPVAAA